MTPSAFLAVVKLAGINPYVDVPARVVATLGLGTRAPVLVKVAAARRARGARAGAPAGRRTVRDAERLTAIGRLARGWFRTTLVPSRTGPTRLYLDTWMRDSAQAVVGDRVRVTLRADRAPRQLQVPPVLQRALAADPDAAAAWEALAPSSRREMLSYLNFLKTAAARERTVQKILGRLRGKRRRT